MNDQIQIVIDFNLYKELTNLRKNTSDSYSDVIRRLLANKPTLKTAIIEEPKRVPLTDNGWSCKGVYFPEGTQFKMYYKNQRYLGEVNNGMLSVEGKRWLFAALNGFRR